MTTGTPASLLGFEYQALIDDISKKSIGFQTTIEKDCSQAELDAILDKCRAAVTRQRVFAQIEAKSIDLRNFEETILHAQKEIAQQDKQFSDRADQHEGRASRGLSASEQKDRQAKLASIDNAVEAKNRIADAVHRLREMVEASHSAHTYPNGGEGVGFSGVPGG